MLPWTVEVLLFADAPTFIHVRPADAPAFAVRLETGATGFGRRWLSVGVYHADGLEEHSLAEPDSPAPPRLSIDGTLCRPTTQPPSSGLAAGRGVANTLALGDSYAWCGDCLAIKPAKASKTIWDVTQCFLAFSNSRTSRHPRVGQL